MRKHNHITRDIKPLGQCPACDEYHARNKINCEPDGNVHAVPTNGSMKHIESKDCWCEPAIIQDVDDEYEKQVWSHKGYEELEQ